MTGNYEHEEALSTSGQESQNRLFRRRSRVRPKGYIKVYNTVTRKLLRSLKFPLAIPSANLSSAVSPVCSNDVLDEFGNKLSFILDGGKCKIGLESTVVNLSKKIKILRPGAISAKEISKILKQKVFFFK